MTKYTTIFASLLRYLSRSDFVQAVSSNQGDKYSKSLTTFDLFKTMLYGQLADCFSVREIIGSMAANIKRLYHAGLTTIKRSTFCDAMEKRKHQIFQSVFHSVVEKAQSISARTHKKFKDPLRIVDATVISVCLKKYPWAYFRKAKGAVKLHALLDGDNLFPIDARLSRGNEHEVGSMHWLCQESGVIYVMDKGYVDYKSLYNIELQGSKFVTRMKNNGKYRRVKLNTRKADGPVISDMVISLSGYTTNKKYPKELRRIRYYDETTRKTYDFLTNDFEKHAEEIASIYKERWEVELFFRWLKQNLKIKSFWGTSENAVYMQIWTALILSVLLWICKTVEGITDSAHQMIQKMKTTLLCKGSIRDICMDIPPPLIDTSNQLLLWGKL
jgi:transposase